MTDPLKPAAAYVRMSTDLQRYSTTNQLDAITQFAATHGWQLVRTYVDEAKSGLRLTGRPGLQDLLSDVVTGTAPFETILVYDISRWGRFQDIDESAHYEFLCRRAGIPVVYCTEPFGDDVTPLSGVMKSLKRVMAGEYSRELSAKVLLGKKRIAAMGFATGAPAPYGMRRAIVRVGSTERQVMDYGQRKALQTDRVVLVAGPANEVALVQQIFVWFVYDALTYHAIADRLTESGVVGPPPNHRWTPLLVKHLLANSKYVGLLEYNRTRATLSTPRRANALADWIRVEGGTPVLVDRTLFDAAQIRMAQNPIKHSDEYLLAHLRTLWLRHGRLSMQLVRSVSGGPAVGCYIRSFGSLNAAFDMLGYSTANDPVKSERKRQATLALYRDWSEYLMSQFAGIGIVVSKLSANRLKLDNGITIRLITPYECPSCPEPRLMFYRGVHWLIVVAHESDKTDEVWLIAPSHQARQSMMLRRVKAEHVAKWRCPIQDLLARVTQSPAKPWGEED